MSIQLRALVIDDEPDIAEIVQTVVNRQGFDCALELSSKNYQARLDDPVDLLILDLQMPGIDGIEIIRHIAKEKPNTQLIIISGMGNDVLFAAQELAKKLHVDVVGAINKPFRIAELSRLINNINPATADAKAEPQLKPLGGHTLTADRLKQAIKSGEIKPQFLPQVDLKTGRIMCAEALARWYHPEFGELQPAQFIALAEQSGLIGELTNNILRESVACATEWKKQGINALLGINLSAKLLKNIHYPDELIRCCDIYQLKPEKIILEVTESTIATGEETALEILIRLRMKGFKLAIDDFGSGQASLQQLQKFPFDELKIDRSLINNMLSDKNAASIVETVATLAHKLSMVVVAEGIESKQEEQRLIDLGYDQGQGFFYTRPLSGQDLIKRFRTH